MRRALRSSVLVLCAMSVCSLLAIGQSQDKTAQAKPRDLRIMTYNIKHGQTNASCTQPEPAPGQPPVADCNLDLSAAIEVIRAHDPDIVGVQEVDRFWARAARTRTSRRCFLRHSGLGTPATARISTTRRTCIRTCRTRYGTVVLSRFPILECTTTPLRRTGTNEQRGLTLALINVRGVRLRFYNTHLHTTAANRLMQTADIAGVIDAAGDGPKIIVGDFNARPTAAELAPIHARFVDGWAGAGVPAPDNPNGLTSPARLAGNPTSRIDYTFLSSPINALAVHVPIDDRTRLAADHYPVVTDIALPGSEVGVGRGKGQ